MAADAAAAAAARARRRRAAGGRGGGARRRAGGGRPDAGRARTREKRKDPGADLILRNLATGDEVTIPEVNEYEWNTNGDWIAYAVSSTDAAKDGAFARHIADGAVKTLHTGRGHYKSLAFDEAGTQLAFLSDEADYAQKVSPYRLYYWKARATPRRRRSRRLDGRHAEGHGRQRIRRAALLEGRRASLSRHRRAARARRPIRTTRRRSRPRSTSGATRIR